MKRLARPLMTAALLSATLLLAGFIHFSDAGGPWGFVQAADAGGSVNDAASTTLAVRIP